KKDEYIMYLDDMNTRLDEIITNIDFKADGMRVNGKKYGFDKIGAVNENSDKIIEENSEKYGEENSLESNDENGEELDGNNANKDEEEYAEDRIDDTNNDDINGLDNAGDIDNSNIKDNPNEVKPNEVKPNEEKDEEKVFGTDNLNLDDIRKRIKESAENIIGEYEETGTEDTKESGDNDYEPLLPDEEKFALQWIDNFKNESAESKPGDKTDYNRIAARILAARILVDSEPGNKRSLKKYVEGSDIDRVANVLLNNETFKGFTEEMGEKGMKSLIESFGHGGKIEDKLRNYILKQPAGNLHNDRILDRCMPRVIDRIEELQNQAKKIIKRDENPNFEMAEIMVLRSMVGARQSRPDLLAVKIPTINDLAERVSSIANSNFTDTVASSENVQKDLQRGHGGDMIQHLMEKPKGSVASTLLSNIGEQCSVDTQFSDIQYRAKSLQAELNRADRKDKSSDQVKNLKREARELVAQTISIYGLMRQEGHKDPRFVPPLNKVQSAMEITCKNKIFQAELFPYNNTDNYLGELQKICSAKKLEDYAKNTVDKLAKENSERKAKPENSKKKQNLNDAIIMDDSNASKNMEKPKPVKGLFS
ncbi:MAG: hypothetical protein IKO32_08110, partial [Lachnospiraceae bacterium]|nr:hypothetical protein [Lachnospiraceae bacterium]